MHAFATRATNRLTTHTFRACSWHVMSTWTLFTPHCWQGNSQPGKAASKRTSVSKQRHVTLPRKHCCPNWFPPRPSRTPGNGPRRSSNDNRRAPASSSQHVMPIAHTSMQAVGGPPATNLVLACIGECHQRRTRPAATSASKQALNTGCPLLIKMLSGLMSMWMMCRLWMWQTASRSWAAVGARASSRHTCPFRSPSQSSRKRNASVGGLALALAFGSQM